MTAASFADDMIAGGGKYAAVFHIAGMPWAVTTSTELVAALADPDHFGTNSQKQQHTYRRLLFGEQWVAGAPQCYPSDHVQIVPSLDPDLGKQSISYDESKGLTGGGWSVKFERDAHGAEYSHFRTGAVAGTYDGLDVMPDPIYDATVKTGVLAADWDGSGNGAGTLTWGLDTGLLDLVVDNSAASNPVYAWTQSSCIGLDDDGLGTNTANGYGGCLRTVREKINVITTDGGSTMIASAPMTTIVGMAAILYLIPMTADGEIVDIDQAGSTTLADYTLPIILREGPVQPNPTFSADEWKISCGFFEDFMNVDIPAEEFNGELRGYRFHRQSATSIQHVQMGHLELLDYDDVAVAYQRTSIWLCDAGDSVYFGSKTALAEALNTELADRTHSDIVGYPKNKEYSVSYKLMHCSDPTVDMPTFINGPCAWILRLGLTPYSADNMSLGPCGALETPRWEVHFDPYTYLYVGVTVGAPPPELGWQFVPNTLNPTRYWNGAWDNKPPGYMKYYYQWNFRSDYHCELGWYEPDSEPWLKNARLVDRYPVPYHTSDPRYRLAIDYEYNAQTFDDGEDFTVGGPSNLYHLTGKVDSTADNYIVVDDQDADGTGVTQLKALGTAYNTLGDEPSSMFWGQPLYYWPALHPDGDPFPVSTNREISSDSLVNLFKGVMGDSTALAVPRRTAVYHVPDAWDDTYDMREVIDWDRLKQLAPAAANVRYSLQLGSSINLKKSFFGALLGIGIRQTWGYIESIRAFGMSFEEFGVVSPAKAISSGRILDNSNLVAAKPTGTYGNTWLYNHAEMKYNYKKKEFSTRTILNHRARSMMSSGNKMLKVDNKIIQLTDNAAIEDYLENFTSMLFRMNTAQPNVSATGAAASLPLAVVGADCLVTSDLIYDLFSGKWGATRRPAMMTQVSINVARQRMDIGYRLRIAEGIKGIGPAMRLTAAQITKAGGVLDITGCTTDHALNEFGNPLIGLTDLAYFGCFDWNSATDAVTARSCSCAKYAITIIDQDVTTWDNAGAGRNVYRGRIYGESTDTLTLADLASGKCRISIDTDYASFDAGTDKIIFFCEYDNANLQECQDEMYAWLGDKIGRLTDTDGNTPRAATWS